MLTTTLRRTRSGFTLIELIVVISIIGLLIGLLMPAVQSSREAARRMRCRSRLAQLSLALHNYHDTHRVLPPGSISRGVGDPLSGWGWTAMILPNIDQSPLYNEIDFHQPTAVGSNLQLISKTLPLAYCPSDSIERRVNMPGPTGPEVVASGNYAGVESMLNTLSNTRFAEVSDGLTNTFLLGENSIEIDPVTRAPSTVSWCGRVTYRAGRITNSQPHHQATAFAPLPHSFFSSQHPGGVQFSMGDGSVHFFSHTMDAHLFGSLGTARGAEVVSF